MKPTEFAKQVPKYLCIDNKIILTTTSLTKKITLLRYNYKSTSFQYKLTYTISLVKHVLLDAKFCFLSLHHRAGNEPVTSSSEFAESSPFLNSVKFVIFMFYLCVLYGNSMKLFPNNSRIFKKMGASLFTNNF